MAPKQVRAAEKSKKTAEEGKRLVFCVNIHVIPFFSKVFLVHLSDASCNKN